MSEDSSSSDGLRRARRRAATGSASRLRRSPCPPPVATFQDRMRRARRSTYRLLVIAFVLVFFFAHRAQAQVSVPDPTPSIPALAGRGAGPDGVSVSVPNIPTPSVPKVATPQAATGSGAATISVDLGDNANKPSNSILIILGLTVLSVAPSLLIMTTSFTRMIIVLSLTRNALGIQTIPPNQVITGLALFLSLFVMAPTLSKMNDVGLQPLLKGDKTASEAFDAASVPLKDFMLRNTRKAELSMMISASGEEKPDKPDDVSLPTLIPAFILSELKTAFIIGFVIFIPFLVIDLVVSSVLMSLGMMMVPPVFVSLPLKILLFVMVDGWSLVAENLVRSFH